MDLPAEVQLYNELSGLKGNLGSLVAVSPHGYYEVNLKYGANIHRVLLPVGSTVVIFRDPEPQFEAGIEIER
jgi:hypothetical protein